ncbi:MAG TPA: hypothetical protein VKD24_05915 [Candidatus Angelobacter sp.]|nr:hypothetical protein [Candidatus Angelobacter sp.]
MTEGNKHRLNFSVMEFVNRYCDQHKERFSTHDVADAYRKANPDLIRTSGVTVAQLSRMVEYVLWIGYPEDPFLCSEFDLDIDPADAPDDLAPADFDRIDAALALRGKEMQASGEVIRRITHLLRPYAGKQRRMGEMRKLLEADYRRAKAGGERESWTEEIDSLVAPVRRLQPELGIADALLAVMPKRLAVPCELEGSGAQTNRRLNQG